MSLLFQIIILTFPKNWSGFSTLSVHMALYFSMELTWGTGFLEASKRRAGTGWQVDFSCSTVIWMWYKSKKLSWKEKNSTNWIIVRLFILFFVNFFVGDWIILLGQPKKLSFQGNLGIKQIVKAEYRYPIWQKRTLNETQRMSNPRYTLVIICIQTFNTLYYRYKGQILKLLVLSKQENCQKFEPLPKRKSCWSFRLVCLD